MKMNKVVLFVSMMMGLVLSAQSTKQDMITIEKNVLHQAQRLNDLSVAKSALYRLIELEGENSTYKDSLTYVFFTARQYAPCFMMAEEVLKREPNHKTILEIKAVALEALGALDKSMEAYQQLFKITNDNFHGYNVAKLQLSIQQPEAAYTTIQQVEKLNDSGNIKVSFAINQNHNQEVELLAAIPYLKGLIEEELKKTAEAKVSYDKALKVQPDFVHAKERLEALNNAQN